MLYGNNKMKIKKYIIEFFIALFIFWVGSSIWIKISQSQYTERRQEARGILEKAKLAGEYLIQNKNLNNQYIVNIGPKLIQKLDEISQKENKKYMIKTFSGDVEQGDSTATHHILISNGQDNVLGIRLKYDKKLDKFHILGFWTPRNENI